MIGICRVCSKTFEDTQENTSGPEAVCSRDCLLKLRGEHRCKQCGYESKQNYQGYCFQCAVDKGIEKNPFGE